MILSYAPPTSRAGLAALLALDDTLADIVRNARDRQAAQLRMTWWHDALSRLDSAPPPAEPVLRGLASEVLPRGVAGAELTALVEGWEELLEDDPDLVRFAKGRGALFTVGGRILGGDVPKGAGEGWALGDVGQAAPMPRGRWPRRSRALGAMAHLAAMPDAGAAKRTMRALWHRATGW